jgi:hypothetical protein
MPFADYSPVNPNTTTREAFTKNITDVAIPSNATPAWSAAVKHQQTLYRLLYDHPAMEPNRQQTFMTKAAQKSSIYHTWDFVGRTLQFLYMCEYDTPREAKRGQEKQIFEDALARAAGSKEMITDESGRFEPMYNTNIDIRVPFSDEIKRAAADYDG